MSHVIVYAKECCPDCDKLKSILKGLHIEFDEQEIETKESIIDLRCLGCFPRQAPVLRFGRTCYESPVIFDKNGEINMHVIHAISGL